MLWEADFAYARYRYQDLAMDPAAPVSDNAARSGGRPRSRSSKRRTRRSRSKRPAIVNMSDFDATLYFLDENEIEYLQSEIKREYEDDLRSRVTSTLLDIFEQQATEYGAAGDPRHPRLDARQPACDGTFPRRRSSPARSASDGAARIGAFGGAQAGAERAAGPPERTGVARPSYSNRSTTPQSCRRKTS